MICAPKQEEDPMRNLTRRQFLQTIGGGGAVVSAGSLLAGASLGSLAPSLAIAQGGLAGQSIIHWSLLNPEGKSLREVALKEILGKFKERSGIAVTVQTLPWQELGTKLIAAVQAGNPPDSSRVNIYHLKMILKADALVNLDPYLKKAYTEAQRKDFIVDFTPPVVVNGSKWSMQIETTPKALFIRKDWLAKAGGKSPKTWAELVEVAKAMTGGGKWGYMFNGSKTQLNQVETIFQPHIHGRGGHILDANEKGAFNDEAAVKSYQFLSDCIHKHKITPPQVIAMTYDEVTDAFKGGRVGMIQEGSHRYTDIAKAIGVENLEVAKLPSDDPRRPSPTVITGWGFGIPRGSKHADAAWEYLTYYIGAEAQEINARVAGSLPTRKSVLDRPFFQTKEAAYMRWWMDYSAERGEIIINVPTFTQLNEVMVDALQVVLNTPAANMKQTLDDAVKRYNQILQMERQG
jgi:multiple sugar transport system substrate-binding protein